MICLKNVHYLALIICPSLTAPALGMGTLITADGTTITASRTLVARHADKVQLITQVKYGAPADSLIGWLPYRTLIDQTRMAYASTPSQQQL